MTRHFFNYIGISTAIILILYLLIEAWLGPDPKGIGHAIIYFALALILGFAGTIIIVISFVSKANWLRFLKTLLGLSNSLFIFAFIANLNVDISFLFLLGYTSLTGFFLIGLTVKQTYDDTRQIVVK